MLIQVNLLGFCTCYVFEQSENDSLPKTVYRFHFILQSYHWLSSITPILFVTYIHTVHFDSPQVYRFQVIEVSIHLPNLQNRIKQANAELFRIWPVVRSIHELQKRSKWMKNTKPTTDFDFSIERRDKSSDDWLYAETKFKSTRF